ncbi:hypothetical protein [Actinoplanes sp. L3-i22]|uniref:hypothetical protein n=1 Tax=Actinoplanes sp. L3-i22 TaxID=2836373 RepID=UPI001C853047|nr:hypothetical protein [Actinoplanes sp. L3-i22]
MSVPRWIRYSVGPVLVAGLVAYGLLGSRYFPEKAKTGPEAIGECRVKPDTVRDIRKEQILLQAPPPDRFSEVDDHQLQCATPALAAVIRPLTGVLSGDEVRDFYADLAERSGWRTIGRGDHVYAALKDADGGCPWWFVVDPASYGFDLRVSYLPTGVSADECTWKS